MAKFKIKKGNRFVRWIDRLKIKIFFNVSIIKVSWVVHESCLYRAPSKEQGERWQKVGGIGTLNPHQISARMGFRTHDVRTVAYASYIHGEGDLREAHAEGMATVGSEASIRLELPKRLRIAFLLFPHVDLSPGYAPHDMTFDVVVRKIN